MATVIATLILSNASCRRGSKTEEAVPSARDHEQAQVAEIQDEKAPILGLTVNTADEADTYPGWPVLVELELYHPKLYTDQAVQPLVISGRGDSWTEAIVLSVEDQAGRTKKLPFKLAPIREEALTLDTKTTRTMRWWLPGDDTRSIGEGDYRIVATLDTGGVKKPGIWLGRVASKPAVLHFRKEPAALDEKQAETKQLLLAAWARDSGDSARAMEHIDALLKDQPESLQGLAVKAGLLEKAGDKKGAMKTYEKAIIIFNRKYPKSDPPEELWDKYNRLIDELTKK